MSPRNPPNACCTRAGSAPTRWELPRRSSSGCSDRSGREAYALEPLPLLQRGSGSPFRRTKDERAQPTFECLLVTGLALPQDFDSETELAHRRFLSEVASAVVFYLEPPKAGVRPRDGEKRTAFVPVPEAAVDEDAPSARRIRDVWTTRQPVRTDAITDAEPVERAPDSQFGLSVPLANHLHPSGGLGVRTGVRWKSR